MPLSAMKFLKAVRLDDSDARIYAMEGGAAADGEWVVSGGYAVCDLAAGHRRPPCHCDTTFVGVISRGRCTLAEVADIDAADYAQLSERLTQHFLDDLGAPSRDAARQAAAAECAYTADLAAGFPADVWITVKRQSTPDGIGEHYAVFRRLMIGAHKL
jgi:hypothetical protein